jgi:adenylosuccinate lyase
MTRPNESYRSVLETRYASAEMRRIWSDQRKFSSWRKLWVALAEAEHELGLNVTAEQVRQLREHVDNIDLDAAAKYEAELRHDVMAHIKAYGDVAPGSRAVIHLGATSQFVNCNTELGQIRDGLEHVASLLAGVIDALASFAVNFRAVATLGWTHLQPAQPTTVGKRAAMWAYDFVLALEEVEHRLASLRFRGCKGATGTQASFLELFEGDHEKVREVERRVAQKMGWPVERIFPVTGQTYPRIVDAQILSALGVAAAAVHKCCNDIRLLASRREVEEPFESSQVGSSAMPYKRNPMRCERATGLARFVISLVHSALDTAATQWLERTLDDSANRRLVLPESFLALDSALGVMHNVASGLVVNERVILSNLMNELPFIASENVLMAAVKRGADRQAAHEAIRTHSHSAAHRMKDEGGASDLLERLKSDPAFKGVNFGDVLDPNAYVGRAPQQVDEFIENVVKPIRGRYRDRMTKPAHLKV